MLASLPPFDDEDEEEMLKSAISMSFEEEGTKREVAEEGIGSIKVLGSGGFGIVMEAEKKVMNKKTLLKMLIEKCAGIMDSLKKEMSEVDYVVLTADIWKGAKRGFMGE